MNKLIYQTKDDEKLLKRLMEELGASASEVVRRGLKVLDGADVIQARGGFIEYEKD